MHKYFTKYWKSYLLGSLFLIGVNSLAAFIPQLIKKSIDLLQNNSISTEILSKSINEILLTLLASALLMAFLRTKSRHIIFGIGRQIEFDLKKAIFNHLIHLEPAFFESKKAGDLISIITNDVQSFRALGGFAILNILNSAIAFSIIVPLMWQINSTLTISFLSLVPILIIFITYFSKAIKSHQQKVTEMLGKISHFIEQNLSGIHIIKSYGQEEAEIARFQNQNNNLLQEYLHLIKARSFISPIMKVVASLGFILLLYIGGKSVIENSFSLGDFAAYSLYIERLIWPLATLGWLITIIYRVQVSAKRIQEVLSREASIKDLEDALEIEEFRESIELKSQGVTINKGQIIGLVGPIGSGKSILAKTIMRLHDCDEAEIFIDNIDIKKLKIDSLRKIINIVPQETFLFSTSIAENIAYGVDISQEEIEKFAKAACFDQEIPKFDNGYETVVGERGITLSGGQRQRVAIARALAINPVVLILDDALSSIDNHIASKILKNILELRKDKTTIFITHKLQIIENADQILVMNNFKIVEQGTHKELLEDESNFIYKQLWNKDSSLIKKGAKS